MSRDVDAEIETADLVGALIKHLLRRGLDETGVADRAAVAVLMALHKALAGRTDLETLAIICIAFDRGDVALTNPDGQPYPYPGGRDEEDAP